VVAVGLIVQKFGGSSLADPDDRERAADRICSTRNEGHDVVAVVSAVGRYPCAYSTDGLLQLIVDCTQEQDPRESDLLMSCGEIISAVLMAHLLRRKGCSAVALTGGQAGIVTTADHREAHIIRVETGRIQAHLGRGEVVVVAGFQGVTETGEITTLGRGGSDTTAAALGCALSADRVEIYTDVDGIMTADPRIVPAASTVRCLSYREVCEMAQMGARVIHPRAVEIAMEGRLPIRIRNTFTDEEGTLVGTMTAAGGAVEIGADRLVASIAHIPDLAQVRVEQDRRAGHRPSARDVFRGLADSCVSIDLINLSPDQASFTIKASDVKTASEVLSRLGANYAIEEGFAKVSAVGAGMRGVPGVMATIVEALSDAGVRIHQTADSHQSISCLVRMEDMEAAVKALHDRFGLAR
jgi:aspartate kinase